MHRLPIDRWSYIRIYSVVISFFVKGKLQVKLQPLVSKYQFSDQHHQEESFLDHSFVVWPALMET